VGSQDAYACIIISLLYICIIMSEYASNDESQRPIIESADDAAMRQLSGAVWLGNAGLRLTLPSGRTIGSEEAQAFASYFGPQEADMDEQ
jgi:hypothetical protein